MINHIEMREWLTFEITSGALTETIELTADCRNKKTLVLLSTAVTGVSVCVKEQHQHWLATATLAHANGF